MINEELLTEAFSNWVYKQPTDPEKILYDFYFFTVYADQIGKLNTRDSNFDFALEEGVKDATNALQKHMLKALKFSTASELRHLFDAISGRPENAPISQKSKRFVLTFRKFLDGSYNHNKSNKYKQPKWTGKRMEGPLEGEQETERINAYKAINATLRKLKMSNSDYGIIAEDLFKNVDWDGGYGGKAWASIAEGYKWLEGAKNLKEKIKFIDHAYDLQHNNDTVFQKLMSYYKEAGGEYRWIARALDWKRDVQDVRGFYNKVSTGVKPIVAYAAKNISGKTMQDYKDPSPKRTWDGGEWPDDNGGESDVWDGGVWLGGTFSSGTWKDGVFKGGTFGDAVWEKGKFLDGGFYGGKWKSGTWGKKAWWSRGQIWSKKFKQYIFSNYDPNKFKTLEKASESAKELMKKVKS